MAPQMTNHHNHRIIMEEETQLQEQRQRKDSSDDSIISVDSSFYTNEDNTTLDGSKHTKQSAATTKSGGSDVLARRETKAVSTLRVVATLTMIALGMSVSLIAFFVSHFNEVHAFESHYQAESSTVLLAFERIINEQLGVLASLAVTATSFGLEQEHQSNTNATDNTTTNTNTSTIWPFVTLPGFHQKATTAKQPIQALYVSLNPHVSENDRDDWEHYVMNNNNTNWIHQSLEYQSAQGYTVPPDHIVQEVLQDHNNNNGTTHFLPIYQLDPNDGHPLQDPGPGPYMPTWQHFPIVPGNLLNRNLLRNSYDDNGQMETMLCQESQSTIWGQFVTAPPGTVHSTHPTTALLAQFLAYDHHANNNNNNKNDNDNEMTYQGEPMSNVYIPVFDTFVPAGEGNNTNRRTVVATVQAIVHWKRLFQQVLPPFSVGLAFVLENGCDQAYTFEINGNRVDYIGPGHLQDADFDQFVQHTSFAAYTNIDDGTVSGLNVNVEYCPLHLYVYPTQEFYKSYSSSTPEIVTGVVALAFVLSLALFLYYDHLVEVRQEIVQTRAEQTTAIVSSLFPKNVRDRMLHNLEPNNSHKATTTAANHASFSHNMESREFMSPNQRLKSFVKDKTKSSSMTPDFMKDEPIADLFPEATVFFADIAGFTAWSSTREPSQVFILLQNVYHAFDSIAKRRKVFKVETIGDSYVAVTGLPEPQTKHAVIMARFAAECLAKMKDVVNELEVSLGPDTADLTIRVGLHSGPVTAGVLLGERARFQLFGDTVNTASRMESTGVKNKIQVSESTAQIIIADGKGHWLIPREDEIQAKGKGTLKTFWLTPNPKGKRIMSAASSECAGSSFAGDSTHGGSDSGEGVESEKLQQRLENEMLMKRERLVDWICEMFAEQMKKVMAYRNAARTKWSLEDPKYRREEGKTNIDELADVIVLADFDASMATNALAHQSSVQMNQDVRDQLRQFISMIASMYHNNAFHNFEHACHVTMSVSKILKRIATPDIDVKNRNSDIHSQLNDYTYGITSDPLAILAIMFSAVIHDVDHRGCSNVQLAKEEPNMAAIYRNQSIAEQNSLDISWELLMSDPFDKLRACLFCNNEEMMRFRHVMVNVVLATDIFDKELNDKRKLRWTKAFHDETISKKEGDQLRATIVIEHIIQASDVSHTMQHWHIYRKWNKQLFMELRSAFEEGRMGADPAEFWYKGEIGFFDNYVIPLAKKLKECNVFGVSSDEFLNYALKNRAEWASRGEEIVAEMINER